MTNTFMPCVVVLGLSRSGKDVIANYLAQRHDFEKFDLNETIAEELRRRRLQVTKSNMESVRSELLKAEGKSSIARKTLRAAPRDGRIVVVGIRSSPEMKEVNLVFPDAIVLRIDSDEEKRFARKDRTENISRDDFYDRDEKDLYEGGLDRVFDSADYVIENNQGITPLYAKIEEFLQKYELS